MWKNMVSQTGPRVVRSNFCEYSILNLTTLDPVWDPDRKHVVRVFVKNTDTLCVYLLISEIWSQKGRPGNPDSDVQYCEHELYTGNIV